MRSCALHAYLGAVVLVYLPLLGAGSGKQLSGDQRISHALNRLTFGARPGDLEKVRAMGLRKWLDLQLHPEHISESEELTARLQGLDTIALSPEQLVWRYPPPQLVQAIAAGRQPYPADPQQAALLRQLVELYRQRQANQQGDTMPAPELRRIRMPANPQQAIPQQLAQAKVLRAVHSERQLEEVLTDFWYNHFNVFLDKGADRFFVAAYEREAIRPNVLGKFRDLLLATAKSPAMLFYLDNWQSVDPKAAARNAVRPRLAMMQQPPRPVRGLNENYGRELLELHTLGVDGGYTQQDVVEVARCFTGWTIRTPQLGGEFLFNPRMHDPGEKTVLGVRIPAGGGMEDGLKVIDILSRRPSTAHFISHKLAVRFVADDPPKSLVDRMAKAFLAKDGDIREVLKTMLDSSEFWAESAYRVKLKSPLELVASAVRAAGATVNQAVPLANQIAQMGQPLYRKQEPTGYSNTGADWAGTSDLVARMNFAVALAANRVPGVRRPIDGATSDALGLKLGSPEFQRR